MVHIRPFEEGDTARLLAIEKLCPHGNEHCAVGVDKKSSITARYALYDNWNVLVAEEDDEDEEAGAGEVGGWIGWTVKQSPTQQEPYVYLAEVMVHPDFRRKGVATALTQAAEKHAQETGSNHLYCYIYGPNDASKALSEKLGYSNMRALKSCALTAYKKAEIAEEEYTIERITIRDIPAVVRLINEYYAGYAHFTPYTPEGFASYLNGIPGYGLEQFWVVHEKEADGNVVACAGLWDWSVLAEMCYTKEPRLWKVMRALCEFLRLFGRMPRIPAEGEYFRVYFMTDHAFEPDHADAMSALIGSFNNVVLDANRDFFVANLDPDDPLVGVIKKFKPQIDTWHIYAKAIERDGKRELPAFSPFYVDIRDCIL